MPIYEYHCRACLKNHEVLQKISDKPLRKCPSCGGKLEKKLSLSAFQLKGGGWYKDGYASSAPSTKSSEKNTPTTTTPSPTAETPKTTPAKPPEKSNDKSPSKT